MHVTDSCSSRHGLRHHCTLPILHEGDHRHGDVTWALTTKELATIERHRAELAKLRRRITGQRAEPSDLH